MVLSVLRNLANVEEPVHAAVLPPAASLTMMRRNFSVKRASSVQSLAVEHTATVLEVRQVLGDVEELPHAAMLPARQRFPRAALVLTVELLTSKEHKCL